MTTQKARLLRRGDIIKYTSGDQEVEEVIRDVVIVLQMANGESLSVVPGNEYTVVPQEEEVTMSPREESALISPPEEPAIIGDSDE